tara:strand:- start:5846 stop:6613 length:768 start_codon:yes stop_codon:yes gene_type:complete
MEKVVINEPTEGENLSLEEELKMQEEARAKNGTAEPNVTESTEERPEWLNEKFKSPEELAKAYEELERKQGGEEEQETESEDGDVESESDSSDNPISLAQDYYNENGELSEDMYKGLADAGIPKELVDSYIAGQEAILGNETKQIQDSIGGPEVYESMVEWAQNNLTDEEITAYDDVVSEGTLEQSKMAVAGMFARFKDAGGKAPELLSGSTTGSAVKPFRSAAQVTEAMRDPRYQNDPAYRAEVERRLAVSNAF